jgi:peroxiredoxin
VLNFETNGAFRVDSLPAGTYDLYIRPTDPNDENDNYRELGSLSKQLIIPDGPADQPFDTGAHELRIRRPLRIGQAAPAFENKTLDGKVIKLIDYRGKFVLLHFTAQWANSQQDTDLQTLKSLNDPYVKDGRLQIISLTVDNTPQEAQAMVTNNGITWPVCYLGNWSQTQVPALFGVEGVPHSVLIGPDGKIVAKGLSGAFMKTAVRNALDAKRTASARNLP